MARVSIYVPDDLKERMDAVGDEINWSDVARPAFLMALATHRQRSDPTMQSAIERLRASKAEADKQDEIDGKADGQSWAENDAGYYDLRRVAKIEFFHGIDSLDALYRAVDPQGKLSAEEFKEQVFGTEYADITEAYARAFIEGAQEFYDRVKDEL